MAVKVQFQIGHSSKLRSKKTVEGFTHDWELYVKGVNQSDISAFVEKIIFNLHESFQKPKRGKYSQLFILSMINCLDKTKSFVTLIKSSFRKVFVVVDIYKSGSFTHIFLHLLDKNKLCWKEK